MNAELLLAHFNRISAAPDAVVRLRLFVLDLAVRGKLVEPDSCDVPWNPVNRLPPHRLPRKDSRDARRPLNELNSRDESQPFSIPHSWKWGLLGSLVEKLTDGEHLSPTKTNSGMPLLTATHVTARGLTLENPQFVSEEDGFRSRKRCDPVRGDILICSRGTIGRCAVVDTDEVFCLMGSVILLRFPKEFSAKYFNYYLSTSLAQMQMRGMSGSTAVSALYLRDIRGCVVPVPPVAEQHRIVAKVDELMALCDGLEAAQREQQTRRDQLTASTHHHLNNGGDAHELRNHAQFLIGHLPRLTTRPDQIKQLRQTILNLAVRGKLLAQNPRDESVLELLMRVRREKMELIKEGRIRASVELAPIANECAPFQIPSGWKWANFIDIAVIQSNLVNPSNFADSPHIAPDNIESGTGKLLPYASIRESKVFSSKHQFFAGCILYSKIRPALAKSVVVDFDGLCSADMYPIMPLINRGYLHKYMLSEAFVQQSVSEDNRVAMPKINQESLSKIAVPVPPLPEQYRIVAKVDELMALCDQLEASLATAQTETSRLLESVLHHALQDSSLA